MTPMPTLAAFPAFPARNTTDGAAYSAAARVWGMAMPDWTDDVRDLGVWMGLRSAELAASFQLPLMLTYTFDSSTVVGDPTTGKLRFGVGSVLLLDVTDNLGGDATWRVTRMITTSAPMGQVVVYKHGDPTARVSADVTAVAAVGGGTGYFSLALSNVQTQGAALAAGDDLIVVLQPRGDKGATGNVGPSSNWAADSSYSPTGSPTLITFALPSGASSWRARFSGIAPSSSVALRMAISTDGGSTFGAPASLSGSLAAYNGIMELSGLGRDFMGLASMLQATAFPTSPAGTQTSPNTAMFASTGGATHVQFSPNTGTFNNTGTITTEKK